VPTTDTFYKYNPQNNAWSQILSPPTDAREVGIGFTLGNKGYFGAGWDEANIYADFWCYDPDLPVSIDEKSTNEVVKLYPNPAINKIIISIQNSFNIQKKTSVSISNIQGQLVIQQQLQMENEIDIAGLTKGIYFVKIYNDNVSEVKKLIKE
jgi:hypothetical protein